MKKKLLAGAGIGTILFLFGVTLALAQGGGGIPSNGSITLTNPLACNDILCAAGKIIGFLQVLAVPLCVIMVLVGGFQMMTAAGDPEKFSKGRKTLIYAAIGFVVVIVSGGVVDIIKSIFP